MRARYVGHSPNLAAIDRVLISAGKLDERANRAKTVADQLVRSDRIRRTGRIEQGPKHRDVVYGRPGLIPNVMWEHDGTRPHKIRAKTGKALRFEIGGRVVFAKSVNHPGTQGSRFLTRALPAARL